MISDVASILGAVVSVAGLTVAIWQIMKLRGETRAAREAAEGTQRALLRETASRSLIRANERTSGLIQSLRDGNWERALFQDQDIRTMLIEAQGHPHMPDDDKETLDDIINTTLSDLSHALLSRESLGREQVGDFNQRLDNHQRRLTEIETRLRGAI
jgi:hypothetical protein